MTFLEASIFGNKFEFNHAKNNSPVIIPDHCSIILNLHLQLLNSFSNHPAPETQIHAFTPEASYSGMIGKILDNMELIKKLFP
jgi:hypothetical protein